MRSFLVVTAACALTVAALPSAQQPTPIQTAAVALGAVNIRTLQFTGSGQYFVAGQSVSPAAPWPRFVMRTYTAAIDYDAASMRVDFVRSQAESPPRGGGNQPLVGEQRQVFAVGRGTAWNEPDVAAQPPAAADERTLQILLTPHGFLRGALLNNATMRRVNNVTEASYTVGRHRVVGAINARNEVERVQTWIDHPVFGDMAFEAVYSGYRDFGGVPFPSNVAIRQGGHPTFTINVAAVQANVPVAIAVPDAVRSAAVPPATPPVEVVKVADGVFYLRGGTHHSVAVEMRDHVVVIEAPQNEARAAAVIAKTKETIPGKPIRYVVNTHHHADHSGGLRTFVDEGATVVTHQINRPFYENWWAAPRTLAPDRLAASGRRPAFQTMTERQVLTDGARTIELHHIAGNGHNDGIIMAWLPRERILVEADVFTVAMPGAPPPATPNVYSVNFYDNLQRLKIEPARILGLHGVATDMVELRRQIRRPV